MRLSSLKAIGATSLLSALLLCPAFAQGPSGAGPAQSRQTYVPLSAVIESIHFNGVSPELQKLALQRIGVRVGDTLSSEARQQVGRELGRLQRGMTFTYSPGSKRGTAKLIISADC